MSELADEAETKSVSGNGERVQVPPPAYKNSDDPSSELLF